MRAPYHIRLIRQRDLEALLRVEHASFGDHAYDRKLFAEYFRVCRGLFLVAEKTGRVCGYSLTCTKGDRAELVSIAVDPPERRHGVASALLESTLRRLRRRGVAHLSLMVRLTNTAARRFYEKYGFTRIRFLRGYYEDGADGCLMRRTQAGPSAR